MSTSIFQSAPHYTFTQKDLIAKKKLSDLRIAACKLLPQEYKSQKILTIFDQIKKTQLYSALKTLPKAVLHHVHFDCCEDEQFYAEHVATDPIVYLDKQMKNFKLGTKQQAQKQEWISMPKAKQTFQSHNAFIKHISNFTMLNKEQILRNFSETTETCWNRFEDKIVHIFPILGAVHLFKKYTIYILRKFINNGYDRVQFRSLLTTLNQYNEAGQIIKVHTQKKFTEVFDQAFDIVKKQNPTFSAGFIFFALKFLKPEQNEKILTTVLQQRWSKTIGIDFVQQEDPNGSQAPYDQIANRVLAKFPDLDIKKVYHSGETVDHLNNNVEIAIKAGSVRIGHGINVVQHPELLALCKEKAVCFEQSPISNLVLNYVKDPRSASSQLLLGLGIPVTINPDDPARFGVEDSTMDYFITFISSNWSLRHLKLVAIHSINHAICSEADKSELLASFNKRWDQWVADFITY